MTGPGLGEQHDRRPLCRDRGRQVSVPVRPRASILANRISPFVESPFTTDQLAMHLQQKSSFEIGLRIFNIIQATGSAGGVAVKVRSACRSARGDLIDPVRHQNPRSKDRNLGLSVRAGIRRSHIDSPHVLSTKALAAGGCPPGGVQMSKRPFADLRARKQRPSRSTTLASLPAAPQGRPVGIGQRKRPESDIPTQRPDTQSPRQRVIQSPLDRRESNRRQLPPARLCQASPPVLSSSEYLDHYNLV